MKGYERLLLSHLQEDTSQNSNDPLQDVKKAMGKIAYVSGNPLTKTEIALQISMQFFDATNQLPILPINLPANLQKNLGIVLFGLTDFYGGYTKSRNMVQIPIVNGLLGNQNKWVCQESIQLVGGTWQKNLGIYGDNLSDNGLSNLYNIAATKINYVMGDMLIIYNANQGGLNYLAVITIHCNNVAYGTFLNSFVSDLITINTIRLIIPIANLNQYINPLLFGYQTLFGKLFTDSVDPRMYITSTDFQQQICDIPINLPIDKSVLLTFNLNYDCQNISIILFVEKVESLTHKSNLNKVSQAH
jgi:hypothetical protein